MKIEIWSDIMCPFCYIGKRRFEKSLAEFADKDLLEVEWKSYQLAPDMVTDTSKTINAYMSETRGMSVDQAKQMNMQVGQMAADEGLIYHLENAFVTNSFRAHVLIHFAKKYDKQDEAEEILFRSYFTDQKNVDDLETLKSLADELGLDTKEFEKVLEDGSLDDEVKMDIHEARQVGVKGVPFFVYDRKYAISGAQPVELFLQTLEKAVAEWKGDDPGIIIQESNLNGQSCGIDGCE